MTLRFLMLLSALTLLPPLLAACGDDDGCALDGLLVSTAGQPCDDDLDCGPVAGRPGLCVTGICGVTPDGEVCLEEGTAKGCPNGFRCREITVESGTHAACLPRCGCGDCAGTCDADNVCMPAYGQNCDPRTCTIVKGPPLSCKTPTALGDGPYFTDVTDTMLPTVDGTTIAGNTLAAVDMNGDGWPDLMVVNGDQYRDFPEADPPIRRKHVLRNEADPGGGRHLVAVTQESGLNETRDATTAGRAMTFAIFGDVNNDGFIDAFTAVTLHNDYVDHGDRSEIFLGNGDGTFTMAPPCDFSGPERMATHSAAFLDYDLDGNLDLFIGNQYGQYGYMNTIQQDRLYHGDGAGGFTEVTDAMGLTTDSNDWSSPYHARQTDGVTVCDIDGDGDMDIITTSYGYTFNTLWENVNGTEFRNVAADKHADEDDNLDYSDNERFKCYCRDHPTASDCAGVGSPRIACDDSWSPGWDDQPHRLGGTTFSSVCGDIDNDGDMDLLEVNLRHWYFGQSTDPLGLLLNDGNGEDWVFERPDPETMGLAAEHLTDQWNDGFITAGFIDFDNNGRQDIFLPGSQYPDNWGHLFRQMNNGYFKDIAEEAGVDLYYSHGVAFADFDRDGDLDIVTGGNTMRCSSDPRCTWRKNETHLFRNDVGQDSNWIAIRLVGGGEGYSNVSAIGARIVVTTGEVSQLREIQGGYGHRGIQHSLIQHFGLGDACAVDQVTVFWPNRDFTTSTYQWLPANYFVTIDELTGAVTYEAPAE